MKQLILIIVSLALPFLATGQTKLKITQASQIETLKTKIGVLTTEVEYYRPSKRGRTIFGGLVPYGKLWRTGANINTKLTFDNTVNFGNKKVKAGTYTLFTIPAIDRWEIILHTEYSKYGEPEVLEEKNIVTRFFVQPTKVMDRKELFHIYFTNVTPSSAILNLAWDDIVVPINVTVPLKEVLTEQLMESQIFNLGNLYSGSYELSKVAGEHDLGLKYIEKVIYEIEHDDAFQSYIKYIGRESLLLSAYSARAEIYAHSGNYKKAIEMAEIGVEESRKRDQQNFVDYINRMIDDWKLKL